MNIETVVEPAVTLPPPVAAFVTAEYGKAAAILEYGSGGSTVIAARAGARTFTVESDAAWGRNMERWIAANGFSDTVSLHYADIGPTVRWGRPEHKRLIRTPLYLRYPSSVWDLPGFRHPDVILVDGRFRIACVLTAMERITRPTRLLFDDYGTRDYSRVVERFAKPTKMVERMAVFDLAPRRFTRLERLRTLPARLDPN